MNLAEASFAVLEELKRLRQEGLRDVYVEADTLNSLEKALGSRISKSDSVSSVKEIVSKRVIPLAENVQAGVTKAMIPPPSVKTVKTIKAEGVDLSPEDDSKFSNPRSLIIPDGDKRNKWEWLKKEAESCSISTGELKSGGQIIFGRGNLDAELFFCGEAPSEEDEQSGSAFGSPAGELLCKIIETMGFSESSVYITNILHWKPKHELAFGHRPPTEAEMMFSLPYLKAQLEIVQPKVIIALGKTATDGFLGYDSKRRLGDVRGNWNEYDGIPLMVTYHPSYLLHNPSKSGKRKVWEDMLKVMKRVGVEITDKQKSFFL